MPEYARSWEYRKHQNQMWQANLGKGEIYPREPTKKRRHTIFANPRKTWFCPVVSGRSETHYSWNKNKRVEDHFGVKSRVGVSKKMVGKRIYKPARVKKEWNFENRRSNERTKRERSNKKSPAQWKRSQEKIKLVDCRQHLLLITRYRPPMVAKQEPSKSLRDDPSMMHWACVSIDEEHTRNDMVPMEPYSTRVVFRLFFLCRTF